MKPRYSYRPDQSPATAADDWGDGSWTVECSCGVTFDDGEEMVSCDECGVWVHTRCARFVKGEPSFACHNCKAAAATSAGDRSGPTGLPSDNEETEVAQLLAELPMKTGPTSLPPFRKWAELPLQERVHVQGVPGGDPALFKGGISSVFNANMWRCTGYVPKKFGFQYREFPCWEEGKNGDSQPNVSQGADALFALSKEAEAAVALPQGVVRKIFKLGDVAKSAEKKEKHKVRPAADHFTMKRKDGFGGRKDHSAKKKSSSWDNKRRDSHPIVDASHATIGGSPVPEGKSETKIGDTSEKSTSNDHIGEGFGDTREEMDIDKASIVKLPEPTTERNTIEKSETPKPVRNEIFSKAQGVDESVEAEQFAEALHAMELLKDEGRLKETQNEGAIPRTTSAISEPALLGSELDKVTVKSENDVSLYTRDTSAQPYHENKLSHYANTSQDNNKPDNIKDENEAVTAEEGFAFRNTEPRKHTPGSDESVAGVPKACSTSSDPLTHKSCSSGLSKPARSKSLDRSKDQQVKVTTAGADSKSQSQDHSSKHPIIYHAKGSASSLQKCSQASKLPSHASPKHRSADTKEHIAKPATNVDESSSSSRSKLGPLNTCQKGEGSQQKQAFDACNGSAPGTLQMSDATANLSDEQLALLLHQQLNSSPRVPRVPRLRQTPGMQTILPATTMLSKRSSVSGGRDIVTAPKKKHREETTKECSRESSGMNDGKGSKSGTGQSTSASKDSDKRLPDMPAHQSSTASSTEGATSSNPHVEASSGPGDGTGSKYRTLPGLIDEILNASTHITYEDLCHSVSLHWSNLRKPNGEKYAYSTPVHAVHDILRNRREWAHLIDQASKTNSSKKRKSVIAEGGKVVTGSEKEKSKNKRESEEEEKTEESESNSEDFAKGKRTTARKRRRLELRGRSVKDARKKRNKPRNFGSDDPSDLSDSSSDHKGSKDDANSSDDGSRAQTAGSSSSD